jgi:predicted acetyltransferase
VATVRPLEQPDLRAAVNLFQLAVHEPPVSDEAWSVLAPTVDPHSAFGAYIDKELAGVCTAMPTRMAVPGGGSLPVKAIGRFAVLPEHTRQGVGMALMGTFLEAAAEPLVILRSTEGGIYRHFGFGLATVTHDISVQRRVAGLAVGTPSNGHVRAQSAERVASTLMDLYERVPARPGMVERPAYFADLLRYEATAGPSRLMAAVYSEGDHAEGFALYVVHGSRVAGEEDLLILDVTDMHYTTAEAWAGLWRYFLRVDLIDRISLRRRPADEPTAWLFTDPRTCRVDRVADEIWLRITDVPAALAARTYAGPGSVVIDVRDPMLPANSGRYEVSGDGACRTDRPAQLAVSVADLAALYLGTARPSALAAAGRLTIVDDPAVLTRADRLFAVPQAPWCGTAV